jgi:hypothetical protein
VIAAERNMHVDPDTASSSMRPLDCPVGLNLSADMGYMLGEAYHTAPGGSQRGEEQVQTEDSGLSRSSSCHPRVNSSSRKERRYARGVVRQCLPNPAFDATVERAAPSTDS